MHSQLINSPQQLFPVCLSVSVDMLPLFAVPLIFISPTSWRAYAALSVGNAAASSPPPRTGEQHAETDCDAGMRHRALQSPSAPAGRGGGREWWRNGGMDREEKRQNDGVAIKYKTCSGEHVACCWESALRRHVTAPSLHLFLAYFSNSLWKNSISFLSLPSSAWCCWYF